MSVPTDLASARTLGYGAWNPGVQSDVPWPLLPLSTIFRPENVFTRLDHVHELSDVAGLSVDDLVVFRPERLVVHELLIRLMADFSVPDGPRQEDLGIEFRRMVHTILTRHIQPHSPEIAAAYDALRRSLEEVIDAELSRALAALSDIGAPRARRSRAGGLLGFFRRAEKPAAPARAENEWDREERIVRDWQAQAQSNDDPLRRAACRAIARVASAVRARHGRMWGDKSLLAPIAVGLACNDHSAEVIGALIEPYIRAAVQADHAARLKELCTAVVEEDGADAIILGGAPLAGLARSIADELPVPVVDGFQSAGMIPFPKNQVQ